MKVAFIGDSNINWCSPFGKQLGDIFLKSYKSVYTLFILTNNSTSGSLCLGNNPVSHVSFLSDAVIYDSEKLEKAEMTTSINYDKSTQEKP
jgi:hypothetical protein